MSSSWRNSRTSVKCCRYCVPPTRYPGCGDHCQKYKDEKAELKRQQQEYKAKQPPRVTEYDFSKVRSCASRKRGK